MNPRRSKPYQDAEERLGGETAPESSRRADTRMLPRRSHTGIVGCILLFMAACTPHAATLTFVNHTTKDVKVHVDEQPHTVRANGFVNLPPLKNGAHFVKSGGAPVQTITLMPQRMTVMDLAGDGCYVVVNYTPQYAQDSGGMIVVEERFKKQPLFTTREAMTVPYGDPLPRKVDVGVTVRRLHSVDCSIIEVDRAILEAVSRLP